MGGGSNLLFSDDGFDGVVIKLTTYNLELVANTLQADAGVPLAKALNSTMGAVSPALNGLPECRGQSVGQCEAMPARMAVLLATVL